MILSLWTPRLWLYSISGYDTGACLVAQSCLTLYDPMDCSWSGFSVLGILQARILQWVAISFSRENLNFFKKSKGEFKNQNIVIQKVLFSSFGCWLISASLKGGGSNTTSWNKSFKIIFKYDFRWIARRDELSVQFSCSIVSNSLWPHELQHPRFPCPPLSPGVCSNSVYWVSDAIQPSHPLSSPSPPVLNLSQHFSNELTLHIRWPKY